MSMWLPLTADRLCLAFTWRSTIHASADNPGTAFRSLRETGRARTACGVDARAVSCGVTNSPGDSCLMPWPPPAHTEHADRCPACTAVVGARRVDEFWRRTGEAALAEKRDRTMTALLTADEAARLRVGVNVIVRAGDRRALLKLAGYDWRTPHPSHDPPQDWVALTGPCPTCNGRRCPVTIGVGFGSCAFYANHPGEHLSQQEAARGYRLDCPDCRDGRRIVPLYTECPNEQRHLIDRLDCDLCDDEWRVLVGRASIEVVPVLNRLDGRLPPKFVFLDSEGPGLIAGDSSGFERVCDVDLDPLPTPGHDFGVVVDVTELA